MPIFSLKCFRTDTQVARNRVRGFGLLKPHTVPARIVSPLSGAFSTLSAFQVESVEQPWVQDPPIASTPQFIGIAWGVGNDMNVGMRVGPDRHRAVYLVPSATGLY